MEDHKGMEGRENIPEKGIVMKRVVWTITFIFFLLALVGVGALLLLLIGKLSFGCP